jgi:hypothetical protein
MTMGDVRQMPAPPGIYPQVPSSDDFHPEFGYLCPTPRMRFKIRMIAILASIGIMVGTISVLALLGEGGESDRRELSLPAAAAVLKAEEPPAVTLPPPATAMGALRGPTPCKDLLAWFLDRRCELRKSSTVGSRRVAIHQIVSLPIGRSGSVSANEPPMLEPKAVRSEKGKGVGIVTDISSGLADTSTSNTKPPTKSARRHKRTTRPGDPSLSAYAAAPRFGRDAHNRDATPFGSGSWGAWR